MKLNAVLLAFLGVVAAGQPTVTNQTGSPVNRNETPSGVVPYLLEPKFKGARLKGNKLIVTGENFNDGATIVLYFPLDSFGRAIKTRSDPESPLTTLIAKKGGKELPFDQYFGLSVLNSNGESPDFAFIYVRSESFWALALPPFAYDAIHLHVGDYIVVRRMVIATEWFADPNILTRVFNLTLPSDDDWAFQAVQPGATWFRAQHPGSPFPIGLYNTPIIVE